MSSFLERTANLLLNELRSLFELAHSPNFDIVVEGHLDLFSWTRWNVIAAAVISLPH